MGAVYFPASPEQALHWLNSSYGDGGVEYPASHTYGARAFLDGYANVPLRRGGDCYIEGWRRGRETWKREFAKDKNPHAT